MRHDRLAGQPNPDNDQNEIHRQRIAAWTEEIDLFQSSFTPVLLVAAAQYNDPDIDRSVADFNRSLERERSLVQSALPSNLEAVEQEVEALWDSHLDRFPSTFAYSSEFKDQLDATPACLDLVEVIDEIWKGWWFE